jgi:hypothetical protein
MTTQWSPSADAFVTFGRLQLPAPLRSGKSEVFRAELVEELDSEKEEEANHGRLRS